MLVLRAAFVSLPQQIQANRVSHDWIRNESINAQEKQVIEQYSDPMNHQNLLMASVLHLPKQVNLSCS